MVNVTKYDVQNRGMGGTYSLATQKASDEITDSRDPHNSVRKSTGKEADAVLGLKMRKRPKRKSNNVSHKTILTISFWRSSDVSKSAFRRERRPVTAISFISFDFEAKHLRNVDM